MSSLEFADCGSSGAKPGGMFELQTVGIRGEANE
jgi:hypothetical protein